MAKPTDKFTRLIQLMMLTTSDSDGEALVALRKANAMLAEQNMNWEELLRAKVKFARTEAGADAAGGRERGTRDRSDRTQRASDDEINEWFEVLLREVHPDAPFREFVESVHSFYEQRGYLTPKQESAIRRAYENRR